jgi:spore coat polysaccharide biosynthesis protein SpsF
MYIIIIQARMGSTRLPGKILKKILNKEIILWTYDRCKLSTADKIIIATSTQKNNDILEDIFKNNNILYYRGSETDLLDRYYQIATKYKNKNKLNIIRVTSDCPFIDPQIINNMILFFENNNYDYIINHSPNGIIPEGSGVEIFNYKLLEYLWKNEKNKEFREHATGMLHNDKYKYKYSDMFNIGYYDYLPNNIDKDKYKLIKISVDTEEDYNNSIKIAKYFNNYNFSYGEILQNICILEKYASF